MLERLKKVFRTTDPQNLHAPRLEVIVWKDGRRVFHKEGVFSTKVRDGKLEIEYPVSERPPKTFEPTEYDEVDIHVS